MLTKQIKQKKKGGINLPRGRKPSTTKQQTDEEELRRQWLSFASESLTGKPLKSNKNTSLKIFTKEQINSMLLNPQLNYEQLQNVSQLFMTKSGLYKRIIEYFSYMLSFDTILVPLVDPSSIKNKQKFTKAFETTALYLEKLNVKSNMPMFCRELFINGEVFSYKIFDKKSVAYKLIDNKYCIPYKVTEGVCRYVIDMQKFTSLEEPTSYPKEIQNAYALYKSGKNKEYFLEERYYEVSNNGVCFTFNDKGLHAIPPFSNVFCDLVGLDESKSLKQTADRIETTKMIHNKILLDKSDRPILEPELARKYNDVIKNSIEEGIFSVANPFETEVLSLTDNSKRTTTIVQEATSGVYDSAGISSLLFNNEKASGEALLRSITVDSQILINTIIPMFTDYLSWECSQLGIMNWLCQIQPYTCHNIDSYRKQSIADLAYGGSRSQYLSACGLSPLEGINLLKSEQLLGMDELFVPAQSSHTISGDTTNTGGRPTNKSKGETVSDVTDAQNETL